MVNKFWGLVGICCLITIMNVPNLRAVQSQSNPTAIATIDVAATMESAPTNCGPAPEPLPISSDFAPVIGAWPVWATIRVLLLDKAQHTTDFPQGLDGWWPSKVLWVVKTSYKGDVRLHGYNVADNSSIYFQFNGDENPTAHPILNAERPGAYAAGSEQFANFPSFMWVSKAGCYVIQAAWDGGLWQQTISAGYVEQK